MPGVSFKRGSTTVQLCNNSAIILPSNPVTPAQPKPGIPGWKSTHVYAVIRVITAVLHSYFLAWSRVILPNHAWLPSTNRRTLHE